MQYTESYQQIVDHEGEKAAKHEAFIDEQVEIFMDAVKHGETYHECSFSDLLGYLSVEGVEAWETWTELMYRGEFTKADRTKLDGCLKDAAEKIIDHLDDKGEFDPVPDVYDDYEPEYYER